MYYIDEINKNSAQDVQKHFPPVDTVVFRVIILTRGKLYLRHEENKKSESKEWQQCSTKS